MEFFLISQIEKFERGSWTDDTDQSLLIILAYLHERSIDKLPDSFARRLHIWISHGLLALDRLPCGIGKLVGSTVTSANYLQNPEVAAIGQWVKTGCNIAPNGSLMRTHPIGIIAIDMSEPDAFKLAAKVGRTTHVDPRCTLSCCVVVGVIRGILRGDIVDDQTLNDTIERAYTWVSTQPTLLSPAPESRTKEIDRVEFERHAYAASYEDLHLDDRMSIGYVYKCLGSSLLVLRRGIALSSSSKPPPKALFESLITDLVMEGGDADTNATVAGGLLGAWLGYARLPERWVDGLRHCDWLVHKTYRLIVALGIEDGKVNAEDDEKPEGPKGLLSDEELKKREIDLITRLLEQQNKVRQEKEKRERRGPFFGSRLFKDW